MERKSVLAIAAVVMFALAIGQVQAGIVPGGDFKMYKPGTGYTVTATFAEGNIFARGIGDNLAVIGDGVANYSDGTSGALVDCPGWTGPIGGTIINDLFSAGVDELDGTAAFGAFGTWSAGNGVMVESADPLALPVLPAGGFYEISAMVKGPAGPLLLDLLVDGVALTPSSSVTPASPISGWEKMSRTYDTIPSGDVKIRLGIDKLGGDLYGTRIRFDNVSLDAIPEPATMLLLLGVGGLLVRRKRS